MGHGVRCRPHPLTNRIGNTRYRSGQHSTRQLSANGPVLPLPHVQRSLHLYDSGSRMDPLRTHSQAPSSHIAGRKATLDVLSHSTLHLRCPTPLCLGPDALARVAEPFSRADHVLQFDGRRSLGKEYIYSGLFVYRYHLRPGCCQHHAPCPDHNGISAVQPGYTTCFQLQCGYQCGLSCSGRRCTCPSSACDVGRGGGGWEWGWALLLHEL